MESRRWVRAFPTGGWLGAAALAVLAVTGCGGANSADQALITGQSNTPPAAVGSSRPTAAATVTPTPGQAAAMRFVGAQPVTIGVRGSGLPQQSTLTFQVTDAFETPVGGVSVSFSVSMVADETIAPADHVTDSNGNVQVTLTSGERALSVQIIATVDSVTPPLIVRSTAVDILGAPPSQLAFSVNPQFVNISGRVTLGLLNQVTAFVGDRFGNPVPPGTAVSFTTTGGLIGSPITTNALGQAAGTLVSQHPLPGNGIVATLATTHGERPFDDTNHNGVCDAGEPLQAVSEPYYDVNCNGVYDEGEDFIDLNDNHIFDADQGAGTPACNDAVVIFDSLCTTFSGQTVMRLIGSSTGPIPAGGTRDYTLFISDADGNPIVGGSSVTITVNGRIKLLGPAAFTLGDVQTFGQFIDGVNVFHFSITDSTPNSQMPETDSVTVSVSSNGLPAGGNGSGSVTDVVTFLAAPPPTATPIPTPTPTTVPPAIVPTIAMLSAGTGAPPNSCNGATQTFVVTGGSPPFAISGGGGCISVPSVPVSGGQVTYVAGNTPGDYAIVATDAIGRTVSINVTVQGPSTPGPTPLPTATPIAAPPAIAPTNATLSIGTGAPPNSCNGASQTFVVTGGSPPFAISGGGGCISVSSVPVSGGSVTYTAGNTPGDYAIVATDAIGRTAAINVAVQGPPTPTPQPTAGPTATPTAGAPAALRFVGADPTVIGVRGSGLPGQSTLTFQVTDASGGRIQGVTVNFSVVPLNDETIAPLQDTTDRQGNVHVTLTSGERAVSVQITAQVNSVTPPLSVRATAVDILGAPPSQLHFSLASQFLNISGRVTSGLTNEIRAFVGDRFGNPVPPGTAVSFTTIGGAIGSPVFTNDLGQAVATLVSEKPLPSQGIVSTLATTHGERPFNDTNHNGVCDPGEALAAVSEPYYDANCNLEYDDGEEFIDLNGNQVFDRDQGSGTRSCLDSVVIFESICTTFSAQTMVRLIGSPPGPVPAGGIRDYTLTISDVDGNSIVGGSTVNIAVQGRIKLLAPATFTIPDAQTLGEPVEQTNTFSFSITDSAPDSQTSEIDHLSVTVTSDPGSLPGGGNGSVVKTDVITFLPVIPATPFPTGTPTITPPPKPATVTATPTVTPTPTFPAAHLHLSLFTLASPNRDGTMSAAISALITNSSGVVVDDGVVVRFSIVGTPNLPVGVSVTSPGVTGGPPPCFLCYQVPSQPGDALSCVKYDARLGGEPVTIHAEVDTPSGKLEDTEIIDLPPATFVCPVGGG